MLKLQYVVFLQFGKHTFTQAGVYHYAFPCVTTDTGLVSGCKQVDLVGGWIACRDEFYCKTCRNIS
jgi:hypothetical protein